jgi:peptide/nickel transport system substrate-binding protein
VGVELLPFEKELDAIFAKGALELDFAKRKVLYDRYQEIIYEEKPLIYLFSPISIVAVRKKFQNVRPTSLGGALHNIYEIYIGEE